MIPTTVCPCGTTTTNPAFCSRLCANRGRERSPRPKLLTKRCKACNVLIPKSHHYCPPCRVKRFEMKDITLQEAIYEHQHKSSAYALVRTRARASFPDCPCQRCGYNKHTEVCHIRAISTFPLDTKLSVVNDRFNLLRLCPNCHWEHDNLESTAGLEPATKGLEILDSSF
jgi:hypothetical protein